MIGASGFIAMHSIEQLSGYSYRVRGTLHLLSRPGEFEDVLIRFGFNIAAARITAVIKNKIGRERLSSADKASEVLKWQARDIETSILETAEQLKQTVCRNGAEFCSLVKILLKAASSEGGFFCGFFKDLPC